MKYIKVYCPSCLEKVGEVRPNANYYRNRCRNCRSIVVYNTETHATKVIDKPLRQSSSGITFY